MEWAALLRLIKTRHPIPTSNVPHFHTCDTKREVEVHIPPQTLEETLDSVYLYTTRMKRTKFKGLAKLPSWFRHAVWCTNLSKLFAHSFLPADHLLHSNTLRF